MSARERGHEPSAERESRFMLLSALVVVGALLCTIWWFEGRRPAFDRASLARNPQALEVEPDGMRSAQSLDASSPGRTPTVPEESTPPAAEAALATLSGRMQVDGFAPFRGTVRIREEGRDGQCAAALDRYGRFYAAGVPAAKLRLRFEMESEMEFAEQGRQLLLPDVVIEPRPGQVELVDLDWTTRHVNVQVVDDDGPRQARVDIQGPSYACRIETNERGKARLGLVGAGAFSFRATSLAGHQGEVAVELSAGDELETIVIATAPR